MSADGGWSNSGLLSLIAHGESPRVARAVGPVAELLGLGLFSSDIIVEFVRNSTLRETPFLLKFTRVSFCFDCYEHDHKCLYVHFGVNMLSIDLIMLCCYKTHMHTCVYMYLFVINLGKGLDL